MHDELITIRIDDEIRNAVWLLAEQMPDTGNKINSAKHEQLGKTGAWAIGLFGECAWFIWRHGRKEGLERFRSECSDKAKLFASDNGVDDLFDGEAIDIKSSHLRPRLFETEYQELARLKSLHLACNWREYYESRNQLIVFAGVIGDLERPDRVVLCGFAAFEELRQGLWSYQPDAYAIRVSDLHPLSSMREEIHGRKFGYSVPWLQRMNKSVE